MSNENVSEVKENEVERVDINNLDLNEILSDIISDYEERSRSITGKKKIQAQEIIDQFGNNGVARLTLKEMTKVKTTAGKELYGIIFKEIPDHVHFGGAAFQRVYKSFIAKLKTEQVIADYLNAIDIFAYMKWTEGYKGAKQFSVEIKGV